MELKGKILTISLGILSVVFIFIILFLPLEILEFLSLEIIGEPPINGKTWLEGVEALGGALSMRLLAIFGMIIIVLTIPFILNLESKPIPKRSERKTGIIVSEISVFIATVVIFFFVNLIIGYAWWDPNAFLGLGPLFFHSIVSLIILGLLPELFKLIFKFNRKDFAESTDQIKSIIFGMVLVAFGYGLISTIWHCCSFFDVKMYFFFFVIKLIQLWAMCSFFFKYGLKMLMSFTREWVAYLVISILFGLCYPWHTWGFAITFMFFGVILCYLTRKTDSYLSGLILLYFAYIFHAGLPWQGPFITIFVIFPLIFCILGILVLLHFKLNAFSIINKNSD